MGIEDIPKVFSLAEEVIRRGEQVLAKFPEDGWIRTAIVDWREALDRLRFGLQARDPREVANALSEIFGTDSRVHDSGAPLEFKDYMRRDPTPQRMSQIAVEAWKEIRDDQGKPIDSDEMKARLAAIAAS